MSNIDDLLKKFDQIERVAEESKEKASIVRGRLDSRKEDYKEKKKELAELGITYETADDLKNIYLSKKGRLVELLNNASDKLGLSEEEEKDEFDIDDI